MTTVASILVALVALLHVYFAVLEMLLWTTPRGRAAFGLEEGFAVESKSLAANQGLYNLFLVAGLFGAATVSRRVLLVQALPAALALAAVLVSR